MKKQNIPDRYSYWICIRNGITYLHTGLKKHKYNYDPKICYTIDKEMYTRIDNKSIKRKRSTKVK